MALAIFDLDNTLIAGDSDKLWGQYLAEQGLVDAAHEAKNKAYYDDYLNGTLDIHAFLTFSLRPLTEHAPERLAALREAFMAEKIEPLMLDAAAELLARHRDAGDTLMIITATNRFVTAPIAERLGVEHLLACEPEQIDGRYTGRVIGTPTFREGKVEALQDWMREHRRDLDGSWFYSDSHNDLPLLEQVSNPVAVDADPILTRHAQERGWPVISLRTGSLVGG